MKTALLFILAPCLALGRVGEKYEEFAKRVKVPPSYEKTHKNGLIQARYKVDDITVVLVALNGVITTEHYFPVTKAQAEAIVAKTAAKLEVDTQTKADAEVAWHVFGHPLKATLKDSVLTIRDGSDEAALKEISAEEKAKEDAEQVKKVAPF